ncbi:tryptophan halogenase family protein [Neptunicella marina]|uniref:Tryptophan 7-halogenase n=1 Tax=Neptunicella marina TaxID=2125989 RepID=A0A8J6ITE1_9ALTE|nr:tryptophan halogenase family protein [Neptunicella marina]MBC3765465.1 tryptophan 7-halogenase [Neptunicella marina]
MQQAQNKPKHILIVGGGTAGWMAANLLVTQWPDMAVTLVESKDIGIIGVGEGSTPHLKLFFDAIGVADKDWMTACNATYKNGIWFDNWSQIKGHESYFHPFAAQTDDVFTVPLFFKNIRARMQGLDVNAHPDSYFLETYLSEQVLGPLPAESFPFGIAYGYHFDSGLLGQFLAKHAQQKGVKRIIGNVTDVLLGNSGNISAVKLDDHTQLNADFFIDCSGFNSLLLQQALKVEFSSYKDTLFNDAAVVLPSEITTPTPVATRSTALTNGWAWQIPLRNRFGNGYVYASDYTDASQAETELRQHLDLTESDVEARHLKMKVGRVTKHWQQNCLAVGLSQGFIEPLEATAIALTFNTIAQFIRCFEQGQFTHQYQDAFNQDINKRFDGIRDYVVCHYKANQRRDTNYWRDNANNPHISDKLKHILHLWQHSPDFAGEMHKQQLMGSYQAKSWACMLAGYGIFPAKNPQAQFDKHLYQHELNNVHDFIRRCGLNFTAHQALLQNL